MSIGAPGSAWIRAVWHQVGTNMCGMARLMSIALQYGASLEKVGDLLAGAKFEPCGPVVGHDRIKNCTSLPDLIGRHLLVEYCGRHEMGHVPIAAQADGPP